MMNASLRPAWNRSLLLVAVLVFGASAACAQEKSVRPGINKPYENPNVNEFVKHFESENREVFSKRKEIVAACKLKPGMSVADIGAGTGLFTRPLAAAVGPKGRVYAVDIAPNFVEHVEKTCKEAGLKNVTGVVCTPTSTELPPNSVDLAFICDTYHHFEYPQKTMASVRRALRPGGHLVLIDYCRIEGKTPDWLLKHVRAGQEVVTKEIEAAGFKIVDQAGFLKENYLVRFEKAGGTCAAREKGLSGDQVATDKGVLVIHPIHHATLLIQWNGKTIYVDPVGGVKPFAGLPKPDLVLVTHVHFDHFDPATLAAVLPAGDRTVVLAPPSVAEKIPATLRGKIVLKVLANGQKTEVDGIAVAAVPAYNTSPGKEKFHPKGRDNGYVVTLGGKKVYIAGDTEDTAEMRALRGIDVAFLPMNLPYTMSVPKAADAIRQFKPKIVYPYHYRSHNGTKADFDQLKKLVGRESGVEIRIRDWYSEP